MRLSSSILLSESRFYPISWSSRIEASVLTITTVTENGGIFLKCTTKIKTDDEDIYVSLTGDQIALTKINIK